MHRFLFCALVLTLTACDVFDFGGGLPPKCSSKADCAAGKVCAVGVCRDPGFAGEGAPCSATRDCATNLYCMPIGLCAKAGTGDVGSSCSGDGECKAGLRCALFGLAGSCQMAGTVDYGEPCTDSSNCLAGLFCGPRKGSDGGATVCAGVIDAFPPFPGAQCEPDQTGFRSFFEVPRTGNYPKDFYRLPFPNDIRVRTDKTLDLTDFPRPGPGIGNIDLVALYADTWSKQFIGFATTSAVAFRFSSELDFATTVDMGASVVLVDITTGNTFGNEYGRSWSSMTGRNQYMCQQQFMVRNSVDSPLAPGHTFAALLLTNLPGGKGIKGKGGVAPTQDPDLVAVLGEARPSSDEAIGRAWDAYAPLRTLLKMRSLTPQNVVNAAVFTAQDPVGGMGRLAADAKAQPRPALSDLTLCAPGVKSPCDDGTPERACGGADPDFFEVHGRIALPIYQKGTAPYLAPSDGGGLVFEAGAPKVQRSEKVCLALTIPKKAAPVGGWPLLVYGHGTGGSLRSGVSDVARTAANLVKPMATLGFDQVQHGARRNGSTMTPDDLVFNVLNPDAARDNLIQGAVDVISVLRVAEQTIAAGAIAGVGAPGPVAFNQAQLAYFGHSQGCSSGELALPWANVAVAILSGAGAHLTTSLLTKTSPVNIAVGLKILVGDPTLDAVHPAMMVFQSFFERSDAINYAPLLLRAPPVGQTAKHVYMSYGLGDTYTPPAAMANNANALGVPQATPAVEMGDPTNDKLLQRPVSSNIAVPGAMTRTGLMVKYQPAGYDGHFVALQHPSAQADWKAFLNSWLMTGVPLVP